MACVTSICDERFNLIKALFPNEKMNSNLERFKMCVCNHFMCKHDVRQAELRNVLFPRRKSTTSFPKLDKNPNHYFESLKFERNLSSTGYSINSTDVQGWQK